jgi:hypothetical protein
VAAVHEKVTGELTVAPVSGDTGVGGWVEQPITVTTDELSFEKFGSFLVVANAVLVICAGALGPEATVKVTDSVAELPIVSEAIVQGRAVQVPLTDVSVSPAGVGSVTAMFVAVAGPLLKTVIV